MAERCEGCWLRDGAARSGAEREHGYEVVGLGRDLVLAVAQNAREAQRHAAGIAGRRPDRVPGISSALDGYGLGRGRPAAPFVLAGR
jgi:hypothetical protein